MSLVRLMLSSIMMKWSSVAWHLDLARSDRPFLRGRSLPPFSTFNRFCWLKKITFDKGTMRLMVRCSTHSRMIEEDSAMEIEVGSDEADTVRRPKSVTSINGKQTKIVPESSAEGEATSPDRAIVTARSNAGIVENKATMKRSVGKRHETQLRPANNSQTTLRILTVTIMAGCS